MTRERAGTVHARNAPVGCPRARRRISCETCAAVAEGIVTCRKSVARARRAKEENCNFRSCADTRVREQTCSVHLSMPSSSVREHAPLRPAGHRAVGIRKIRRSDPISHTPNRLGPKYRNVSVLARVPSYVPRRIFDGNYV